jgi:hypothetical protein
MARMPLDCAVLRHSWRAGRQTGGQATKINKNACDYGTCQVFWGIGWGQRPFGVRGRWKVAHSSGRFLSGMLRRLGPRAGVSACGPRGGPTTRRQLLFGRDHFHPIGNCVHSRLRHFRAPRNRAWSRSGDAIECPFSCPRHPVYSAWDSKSARSPRYSTGSRS